MLGVHCVSCDDSDENTQVCRRQESGGDAAGSQREADLSGGATAARPQSRTVLRECRLQTGGLRPEQTDVDSIQYWLIAPDDLANAVVHVIDQPWGISDVTVRASGENYLI